MFRFVLIFLDFTNNGDYRTFALIHLLLLLLLLLLLAVKMLKIVSDK